MQVWSCTKLSSGAQPCRLRLWGTGLKVSPSIVYRTLQTDSRRAFVHPSLVDVRSCCAPGAEKVVSASCVCELSRNQQK